MNQQPPNQPPLGQQGQQVPRFLRPEHMRTIQYLNPQEKQKYEEGLSSLWDKVEKNPPDSQEHQLAKQKIADFSRMVMNKIKSLHDRSRAANAQGQANMVGGQQMIQGQPQPVQTQQAQAQVQAHAQTQVQAQLQAQPQGPATAAQKPMLPVNRPQAPFLNNNNTAATTATNTNNGNNPANSATMQPNVPAVSFPATAATTTGQPPIPRHIIEHVSKVPWALLQVPSQLTPEQAQKWLTETKAKYARALIQMESARTRVGKYDSLVRDRQEKGIPITPDEMKRLQDGRLQEKKLHMEAEAYVKNVQNSLQQPGRAQPMQRNNSTGVVSTHPMQVPTASINAAMDAAKTTQIAAANRAGAMGASQQPSQTQQPQPPQPQAPPALTSNPSPPTQTPVAPATPTTSGPAQPPHPAPAAPTQAKMDSGANAQNPPPVNTALAAATASNAHIQSAGTPTQASARVQTPQSAQPSTGSVRPLTHAAAVIRANSSSNIAAQPNNSSTGVSSNTPNMNGMAAQPGHSHAHPQPTQPTQTLTSKMPIPKTLHEKATAPPQPVTVGGGNTPGRPTYGGGNGAGGVMNQPVIAKMPVLQFDAEGDHVLSKKKLDELIRQICGGGSPGADGNYLTPDVEESVLSVADNFVDSVLHMACRLAKERGSKVLEIRDIQLVLERVYNIRIPGYTSDELRTVRKVQPSSNWIAKMSAIQAAKVTSGKDDK